MKVDYWAEEGLINKKLYFLVKTLIKTKKPSQFTMRQPPSFKYLQLYYLAEATKLISNVNSFSMARSPKPEKKLADLNLIS